MAKIHPQYTNDVVPPILQPPLRHKSLCMLLQLVVGLLSVISIILSLVLVIFLTIFGLPKEVQIFVTAASLDSSVDTANRSSTFFDLALDVTIQNPNKRIGVYYESVQAMAFYREKRFSMVTLRPFYQGSNQEIILKPVFGDRYSDFPYLDGEKSGGVYSFVMKLALRVRTKYGKIKLKSHNTPYIMCNLNVPLVGISDYVFMATQFDNVYVTTKL